MNIKYLAYKIFFGSSVALAVLRVFVAKSWPVQVHVLLFLIQLVLLVTSWEVCKYLNRSFENKFSFDKSVLKRLVPQVSASAIICLPLVFLVNKLIIPYLPIKVYYNAGFEAITYVLLFLILTLMNFSFYATYLFKQWQKSIEDKALLQLQAVEMEKDKSMMQYHHLKNQVNPHFLFNTFTSLDGLIQTNPDLASEFVRHLSKVYRYVLEHKENEIVSLQTETAFINNYTPLLSIRYKNALDINIDISQQAMEKGIVMVTLQMLIDNAIKHNSLQTEFPLKINIWNEGEYLYVSNNKQLRKQIETSNKKGLHQLIGLYAFLTETPVIINDMPQRFEIKLPLL
jgi:two-component system, LytTR family, sensor kinase